MQQIQHISARNYILWCCRHPKHMLILVGLLLVQFGVFKYLYPFPNFLPDSFSYLEAAHKAQHINIWPIGYSRFLWLFSFITRSHWGLVLLQYILLQGAILYFLFSAAYYLKPGILMFRVLLLVCMFSPLLLHVSNFVSSDALFATLSLIWFAQLLQIIEKPTWGVLFLHAVVLLLVFTVRYNALYYPFISITAIILTKMRAWKKRIGVVAILVLLGTFIGYTQWYYDKETSRAQFSPFGGWQLASNALFAYAHLSPSQRKEAPAEFKELHAIVNRHMDSLHQLSNRPDAMLGIYYLWDPQSPLQEFKRVSWHNDTSTSLFARWALMGPMYSKYGSYLITQYSGAYIRHFVWPNLIAYYVPQPEFLSAYNMGKDTVEQVAVEWFGLKDNKVHSNTSSFLVHISSYYAIVLAFVNLLFVLGIVGFLLLKGLINSSQFARKASYWILFVWLSNICFSVLASPIVLRYQVFPMLITQTLMIWLVDYLIRTSWLEPVASDVLMNSDKLRMGGRLTDKILH